jgi:hypothetical protein
MINTHLEVKIKLSTINYLQTKEVKLFMAKIPYSQIVGNLMHVVVHTCFDCSYVVSC